MYMFFSSIYIYRYYVRPSVKNLYKMAGCAPYKTGSKKQRYCQSVKSWPIWTSKLLYKLGQGFLTYTIVESWSTNGIGIQAVPGYSVQNEKTWLLLYDAKIT